MAMWDSILCRNMFQFRSWTIYLMICWNFYQRVIAILLKYFPRSKAFWQSKPCVNFCLHFPARSSITCAINCRESGREFFTQRFLFPSHICRQTRRNTRAEMSLTSCFMSWVNVTHTEIYLRVEKEEITLISNKLIRRHGENS